MEIKNLIWKDNTTDLGKSKGIFHIKSNVYEIGLQLYISNYSGDVIETKDKYFLLISCNNSKDTILEFNSVDEAKNTAQGYFKQKVLELFFK